jgi:geranylgeranyl transferase type-2 subunit beta
MRAGAHALGEDFARTQAGWLEAQQRSDGGFAGRRRKTDLYYTDFGLRAVDLVAPASGVFAISAERIDWDAYAPADLIEVFSLASCTRTLNRHGLEVPMEQTVAAVLDQRALEAGGFGSPGSGRVSAYQSFLGAICLQLVGHEAPRAETISAVLDLQRESGGFAERAGDEAAQTNATAACLALMLMGEGFDRERAALAAEFLVSMQADDGGLRAHPGASPGDLLSTFTGLLSLCLVGSQGDLDLAALARFVRGAARPGGGFGAGPDDPEADVEYTYYGIGSLALLRSVLEATR